MTRIGGLLAAAFTATTLGANTASADWAGEVNSWLGHASDSIVRGRSGRCDLLPKVYNNSGSRIRVTGAAISSNWGWHGKKKVKKLAITQRGLKPGEKYTMAIRNVGMADTPAKNDFTVIRVGIAYKVRKGGKWHGPYFAASPAKKCWERKILASLPVQIKANPDKAFVQAVRQFAIEKCNNADPRTCYTRDFELAQKWCEENPNPFCNDD